MKLIRKPSCFQMELVKSESREGIRSKGINEVPSKEDELEKKPRRDQPKNVTQLESLFYIPQDLSTQVSNHQSGHCIQRKQNWQFLLLKGYNLILTIFCRLMSRGWKRLNWVQKKDIRWLRAFQIFPWISDVTLVILFWPSLLTESVI